MAQREQANVPLLLTIGAVSGFLLIVLALGLQAWYLREVQQEVRAKWDDVPLQPITDIRARQLNDINTYRWVNREQNRVAIPIDQAIKIVAQNQGKLPSAKAE
ncbi:MAG TPA: hypothetical protein VER17_03055 [Tepidisphaeraceae bacterium]|nr:hypothetical protein [Tepidisphaeraceae bacterium]